MAINKNADEHEKKEFIRSAYISLPAEHSPVSSSEIRILNFHFAHRLPHVGIMVPHPLTEFRYFNQNFMQTLTRSDPFF